jgi:hypothetical protein
MALAGARSGDADGLHTARRHAGAGASAVYLDTAAGVTVLILPGRYFEARAKRRSGAALRALAYGHRELPHGHRSPRRSLRVRAGALADDVGV